MSGTVFILLGGIEGRTLAARRALSAVRGWVRRAALAQEPTGRSTTLAHQIENFFPGERGSAEVAPFSFLRGS